MDYFSIQIPTTVFFHNFRLNDLYTSSPQTPSSSVNSQNSLQSQARNTIPESEPIYSNEALQNLVDTLTEEFANENALSYLEGSTTFADQYYMNLYNTTEQLSQSSSTHTLEGTSLQQSQQQSSGGIKSILKKRENVSNENMDQSCVEMGESGLAPAFGSSLSSSSSNTSQDLRVNESENREIEERCLADLSPSHVFLETRYVNKLTCFMF
jgi:hypothetical protein